VTPGPHPPFGDYYRGPMWDASGKVLFVLGNDTVWRVETDEPNVAAFAALPGTYIRSIVGSASGDRIWSPDGGHSFYVRTLDPKTARAGIAEVDFSTGDTHLLFEEDVAGHVSWDDWFRLDAQGSNVVYVAEAANMPEDLWIAGPGFQPRRRLTHINPAFDEYVFGRSQLVTWRSTDGTPLAGALLLPAGYTLGRRYPLVVWVYGGRLRRAYGNRFGLDPDVYNMQLLATRGYAVFVPDAPQRLATPMLDLAKTVLPGVDKIIELGIVDPNRLAVAGFSYGGYSTMALIVQTPRFRAAISIAGAAANLFTQYGQLGSDGFNPGVGWAERGQGLLGGSPWEYRDRYLENSPFFYLDRVQTPLLLINGTLDDAVPAFGADEVFTALRRLGKDVVYVKYEGGGHGLPWWTLAQHKDYYGRVIDWLSSRLVITR
jgi:dipeptidyl aminopeptidase/acylaminoacyl peptidase